MHFDETGSPNPFFKSSLSSEVKKSLVSLIEAKETEIGLTLKQYVQGSNSKLANKINKLVEQKEKEFRDLPSSEDMELEGPSHPMKSKEKHVTNCYAFSYNITQTSFSP